MCYKYEGINYTQVKKMAKRTSNFIEELLSARHEINGFTFPFVPVITGNKPDEVQVFSWGLKPHWAKNDDIRKNTLNAKIETLEEKPSFRSYINNRVLIPAAAFFEWQWLDEKGKQKQKYRISVKQQEIFYFGGIWCEFVDKETGEVLPTFSIITTEANELMAEIHNTKKRMPVIIKEEDKEKYLSGFNIHSFEKPYAAELEAVKVET